MCCASQVIYLDLAFAAENDVEPCLWKYVFYKQIEELRRLLRQFSPSAVPAQLSGGRALLPGNAKEHGDRYARLSTFFRQFLRDSKKFYRSLLNYHLKVAKGVATPPSPAFQCGPHLADSVGCPLLS